MSHGAYRAILQGVHTRGEGGVLFVKGEECAYRFPREFPDEAFRGSLETILEEDDGAHFFIVEERDGCLHLRACPRTHVAEELVRDATEGGACGNDPAAQGADAACA